MTKMEQLSVVQLLKQEFHSSQPLDTADAMVRVLESRSFTTEAI